MATETLPFFFPPLLQEDTEVLLVANHRDKMDKWLSSRELMQVN